MATVHQMKIAIATMRKSKGSKMKNRRQGGSASVKLVPPGVDVLPRALRRETRVAVMTTAAMTMMADAEDLQTGRLGLVGMRVEDAAGMKTMNCIGFAWLGW